MQITYNFPPTKRSDNQAKPINVRSDTNEVALKNQPNAYVQPVLAIVEDVDNLPFGLRQFFFLYPEASRGPK